MLRRDINSAFLSGLRSSHLFSFPLFAPGRVRREPTLQRGNFLEGLVSQLCTSHQRDQHPRLLLNDKNKIISLKENHFTAPESLADEDVGVLEGGGEDSTMALPQLSSFQKNGRHTSAEWGHTGGLLLTHQTLVLSAPDSCCWEWGVRIRARAPSGRGGTEKGRQFNSRKPPNGAG